jgi:hypothetical protein
MGVKIASRQAQAARIEQTDIVLMAVVCDGGRAAAQPGADLVTTPVIYLYLDRLQSWLMPQHRTRLSRLAEKMSCAPRHVD